MLEQVSKGFCVVISFTTDSSWLLSGPLSQGNNGSVITDGTADSGLFFHPPELPVDTLMEVRTLSQCVGLWGGDVFILCFLLSAGSYRHSD